jgi:glycerol-3-phosphate dehydrogenase
MLSTYTVVASGPGQAGQVADGSPANVIIAASGQ